MNPLNADPSIYNPQDPVSGMAAIPRNMTGMAMKMQAGGYKTHMFGITIVSSAMRRWLWPDLNFALL